MILAGGSRREDGRCVGSGESEASHGVGGGGGMLKRHNGWGILHSFLLAVLEKEILAPLCDGASADIQKSNVWNLSFC